MTIIERTYRGSTHPTEFGHEGEIDLSKPDTERVIDPALGPPTNTLHAMAAAMIDNGSTSDSGNAVRLRVLHRALNAGKRLGWELRRTSTAI